MPVQIYIRFSKKCIYLLSKTFRRLGRAFLYVGMRAPCERIFAYFGLYCIEVDCPSNGFFAQLSSLMQVLLHCEREKLTPHILLSAKTYVDPKVGPSFLQYFFHEPKYSRMQSFLIRLFPIRKVNDFTEISFWKRADYPSLSNGSQLFSKYYRIKHSIDTEVDNFAHAHFKNDRTLGIHFRATDKISEASPVSYSQSLVCIRNILELYPELEVIFVASDAADYITYLRHNIPDRPVVYREGETRSHNDLPIHLSPHGDPFQKGHDALVNSLILAKCNVLLKTMSNLSGWSKVFNSSIKVYIINSPDKSGIEWLGFPEAEMIEKRWFVPILQGSESNFRSKLNTPNRH